MLDPDSRPLLDHVKDELGFVPEFTGPQFELPGWVHLGKCDEVSCPGCDMEALSIWRRPNKDQTRLRYWAIVCASCKDVNSTHPFDPDQKETLYAWSEKRCPEDPHSRKRIRDREEGKGKEAKGAEPYDELPTGSLFPALVFNEFGFTPGYYEDRLNSFGWSLGGRCEELDCPTCGDHRLYFWSQPMQGQSEYRNHAFVCSRCRWIKPISELRKDQREKYHRWFSSLSEQKLPTKESVAPNATEESKGVPEKTVELLAIVDFHQPVEGKDFYDGRLIIANRHRVKAVQIKMDLDEILFVGDGGGIVGSWPASEVSSIKFSPTKLGLASRPSAANKTSRAGQSWSEEEDAELVVGFGEGLSKAELARRHQRTRGSIKSHLVKLGLES